MNFFYFDASALVKRYSSGERGASLMNHLLDTLPPDQLNRGCLEIGIGEVVSVLVRQRNDGRLKHHLFQQALALFRQEVIDQDQFLKVPIQPGLVQRSLLLIERHNVNATDALVLRSALELRPGFESQGVHLVLVASDERLIKAAAQHNLTVFNPETNTEEELEVLLQG